MKVNTAYNEAKARMEEVAHRRSTQIDPRPRLARDVVEEAKVYALLAIVDELTEIRGRMNGL